MEKEVLMPATIAYVFSFKTETGYWTFPFLFCIFAEANQKQQV